MEKNKKAERAAKYKEITVQGLTGNTLKAGFLTKRGGRKVNWRRRYCALSSGSLFYFKNQKSKMPQGAIELDKASTVSDYNITAPKKAVNCSFQIFTPKRTFYIFADAPDQRKEWMDAINKAINLLKGDDKPGPGPSPNPTPNPNPPNPNPPNPNPPNPNPPNNPVTPGGKAGSPIEKLKGSREAIAWMKKDEKVGEFWQIWLESMPPSTDDIEFDVSSSLSMEKLGWRSSGPQSIFIQRMVDFFFDVGASENEIDRLNTLGALMEPSKIGPWIEMSDKQGMDGGWFFPVPITIDKAVQAMDSGPALDKVKDWVAKHKIEGCCSVGRDMGAMPPRQATLRVNLPGSIAQQMDCAMDAFKSFGVPPIPENVMGVIHESSPTSITLSIITCPEGFVQLGIWVPSTTRATIHRLCEVMKVDKVKDLDNLEKALGKEGASFCEYKHLMSGFGYGAYKEGFDVMLHYTV